MKFISLINYIARAYRRLEATLVDQIYFRNKNYIPKTLLIIKIDAIGDYILFRNYLNEIRTSAIYKEYRITVCGNDVWRDIADTFDTTTVDHFIWVDPNRLTNDSRYRRSLEKKVYALRCEQAIYPTYSRTEAGDSLVLRSGAKHKLTFRGDARNIPGELKQKNDKKYDELLEVSDAYSFEFFRYKDFFTAFLKRPIQIKQPILLRKAENEKKIVMSPGASASWRRWSIENFHALALGLFDYKSTYDVYVCGSEKDKELVIEFKKMLPQVKITDLTGKLSLSAFIDFVSDAHLVVTNDSGPLHIAAACGVRVIAISNGNNYNRFVPYPPELGLRVKTIFPGSLTEIVHTREKWKQLQDQDALYQINEVQVEEVLNAVKIISMEK